MNRCIALIGFALIAAGCGGAPPSSDMDGVDLEAATAVFEEKCTACHKVGKIEDYVGGETWSGIVAEMSKKMAKKEIAFSQQDAAAVIAYLEEQYP